MLILNRDFKMPEDGWYQLAPLGEFAHANAGVVQVIDEEACVAMAARFAADAGVPHFAGLLVDFDHFSLESGKRSEAAGWIVGLEYRGQTTDNRLQTADREGDPHPNFLPSQGEGIVNTPGLWAQIRWSDIGEEAVRGGRYRFLSPVWARTDCVDLGNERVRPVRLLNAAVTNDPNLKGIQPLSNASTAVSAGSGQTGSGRGVENRQSDRGTCSADEGERDMKAVIEKLVNHLGLAADATEALILEKMAGLPALTAVTELRNSLKEAEDERDTLRTQLEGAEEEIVNRHLAEFEDVVTEKTKTFWREQLVANRAGALETLSDLVEVAERAKGTGQGAEGKEQRAEAGTRKPLHNRAAARSAQPGGGTAAGEAESKAMRIRNRAQEIVKLEKVPFSVAFRRAEKEVVGNG